MPFSLLFGLGVKLRNQRFDRKGYTPFRASVPVVSIGNLSTGGTGKTPLTEYLIQKTIEMGFLPASLSRGYGRKSKGYLHVPPDAEDSLTYGDEPLQIASRFPQVPVAVCEDRATGIRSLESDFRPHIIFLDDAFQHRKVARDLDIVMIDAGRLPWNDCLLPAGRLREPLSSLSRAQVVIVNKLQDPVKIPEIRERLETFCRPDTHFCFCNPEPLAFIPFEGTDPLELPPEHDMPSIILFSGIGNNAFFREMMEKEGFQVKEAFSFPDHYRFKEKDLRRLVDAALPLSGNSAKFGRPWILTTEKDYHRLKGIPPIPEFRNLRPGFVRIGLRWYEGEEKLLGRLRQLLPA
jgi:tetraacyldisaccharide 4'-kinase